MGIIIVLLETQRYVF